MQSIDSKLAKVRAAAPEGWTDDQLRHLIHGTGGSPRRAKRLLRSDPELAAGFAERYSAAITEGISHGEATAKCGREYLAMFADPERDGESEGGDPDGDPDGGVEAAAPAPKPAAPSGNRTFTRVRRIAPPPTAPDVGALRDLLSA